LLPEDETLEDLVRHADASLPEDEPQVEAGGLARVVPVKLQESALSEKKNCKSSKKYKDIIEDGALGSLIHKRLRSCDISSLLCFNHLLYQIMNKISGIKCYGDEKFRKNYKVTASEASFSSSNSDLL
jgi:hypothetical protein